jgi:squalene synthase HpnC
MSAFEQDARQPAYADRSELLDYCSRSADPVGRLLLHLYGIDDGDALRRSDAVCSALQLINFWQDLSIDLPRGRVYLPSADMARHGLRLEDLAAGDTPRSRALVADLCSWARRTMLDGAPLVHRVPGRAGWELRGVVQGGLRILDKIGDVDHAVLRYRPTLQGFDVPVLTWRALTMRPRQVLDPGTHDLAR